MEVERLTVETVARAQPDPQGDVWIMERRLRGFGLRIYPSGRKAYVLVYTRGRARPKLTIGEPGAPWKLDPETGAARVLTPELARAEAVRLLGGVVEGRDPGALRGVAGRIPTLADFAKTDEPVGRYFRDHIAAHKATGSALADRLNLKNHLLPVLGPRRLDLITTGDVVRLHASMSDTPVAANRCVALLSNIIAKGILWGVLPDSHVNPCKGGRVERFEERRTERFLQPDELARVGAALQTEGPWTRGALLLLMLTGARPGEIVGFRREWLNRAAGVGVIHRSKTSKRTKRPRIVPFSPAALAVYDDIPAKPGNPYLIPSPKNHGQPLTIFGLEDAWERVRKIADVEDVRLMDLRHTFASVAAEGGASLQMIGAILGHTNPATTSRYAHLVGSPVRAGSQRVADVIVAAMKVPPKKKRAARGRRPAKRLGTKNRF